MNKPCAHCGGKGAVKEHEAISSLDGNDSYPDNGKNLFINKTWYKPFCSGCGVESPKSFMMEEEAWEWWNRRHVETCEMVSIAPCDASPEEAKLLGNTHCSECRGWIPDPSKYCPNCGRKVVDGEEDT